MDANEWITTNELDYFPSGISFSYDNADCQLRGDVEQRRKMTALARQLGVEQSNSGLLLVGAEEEGYALIDILAALAGADEVWNGGTE